jgi:hypothetical protein
MNRLPTVLAQVSIIASCDLKLHSYYNKIKMSSSANHPLPEAVLNTQPVIKIFPSRAPRGLFLPVSMPPCDAMEGCRYCSPHLRIFHLVVRRDDRGLIPLSTPPLRASLLFITPLQCFSCPLSSVTLKVIAYEGAACFSCAASPECMFAYREAGLPLLQIIAMYLVFV